MSWFFWFSTTSPSMITSSTSPQSLSHFQGHACDLIITNNYKCCHNLRFQSSHFPKLPVSFLFVPINIQHQFFSFSKTSNPLILPPLPTHAFPSLLHRVRIQTSSSQSSLLHVTSAPLHPSCFVTLSQQSRLNPIMPAPTQLNGIEETYIQPSALVSIKLQNH